MNIVEAYIKLKKKLIILISGLSGSGKTKLGKNISQLFKMELVNEKKYYIKDYNKTINLNNNINIINWDSDDVYDWKTFNEDIIKYSTEGVVVIGSAFPTDKLIFSADYHIHIKLSKQNILKKRARHSEKHGKKYDTNIQQMIMNNATYPYYLDVTSRSNITKFINANEYVDMDNYDDILYDIAYDYLIDQINKNVYNKI